jgi:hypothetical protein
VDAYDWSISRQSTERFLQFRATERRRFGRPGGELEPARFVEYEDALLNTIRGEYGLSSVAIVTNMDFGHTDPMCVMPLGLRACIDSAKGTFSINESAVISGSRLVDRRNSSPSGFDPDSKNK